MRLIPFDLDPPDDRGAVRHLQFHPARPVLAAVVGAPDHFREFARYRLDADAPTPPLTIDDPDRVLTPLETGPDPVCSRDLELVAVGMFDDVRVVPVVGVFDTWSSDQTTFWFESPEETVPFTAFAFAESGSHFYAAVADPDRRGNLVRGWNLDALFDDAADAELDPFRRPAEMAADERPTALATDPADKAVVVGTSAGAVWLCDARREKPPRKLALSRRAVRRVQFARDGRSLLVEFAGKVAVIDAKTGERQAEWRGDFAAAALSPTGEQVALVGASGLLTLSDRSGGVGPGYDPGVGPLWGVAYAPDGLTCALGGPAGAAVLWDLD